MISSKIIGTAILGISITSAPYLSLKVLNTLGITTPTAIEQVETDYRLINLYPQYSDVEKYNRLEVLDRVEHLLTTLSSRYKVNKDIIGAIASYYYINNGEDVLDLKQNLEGIIITLKNMLNYYEGDYLRAIQSLYTDIREIDTIYFNYKGAWINNLDSENKIEVTEIIKYYIGIIENEY